jgi:hypothetical protein
LALIRDLSPRSRKKQRHCVRHWRIVVEIQDLEAKLVGYLGSINRDLRRRIRARTATGKW